MHIQMTENFATTAASVASAILIAGTLEVATYRKSIQDFLRGVLEMYENTLSSLRPLTVDERRSAVQNFKDEVVPKFGAGVVKATFALVFGIFWATTMISQAVAVLLCLVWLADPQPGAHPGIAKYTLAIVVLGAATVALVPLYRILNAPLGPFVDLWLEAKVREKLRDDANDSGTAGEPDASGPPVA